MALEDILLRLTAHSPMIAPKGSDLTYAELDNNFIILYDWIKAMGSGGNLSPYNAGTSYANTPPTYVSYSGNIWHYINGTPASGITPGTDPLYWEQVTLGSLTHVQNTDQYIDLGGPSQASALEIYNSIHPLIKTVAQMQALLGAYVPGQRYIITSPGTGQFNLGGIIMVEAMTTNFLTTVGVARLRNAAMTSIMTFEAEYDVQADFFTRVREPISGQEVTEYVNGGLAAWPFNSPTFTRTTAVDPIITYMDFDATIEDCYFDESTTLEIQNTSIIERVTTDPFAQIHAGVTDQCILSAGHIGNGGTITLTDRHSISNFYIGSLREVNLTTIAATYSQSGVRYDDHGSTFVCPDVIDLNGLTTLDITNISGQDFSFAGIFYISTSVATPTVDNFTTNEQDHDYMFYVDATTAAPIDFSDTGGSIFLSGGGTKTYSSPPDVLHLKYSLTGSVWVDAGNSFIH